MFCRTSSSFSAPLSISVDSRRSRSASVDHRFTTVSTVPDAPASMLTAKAVNRSGCPLVCACDVRDSAATASATAATGRNSRGMVPPSNCDAFKSRAGSLACCWGKHRFAPFALAHVDDLRWLTDLQHVERVRVVVNIRDRLSGDLDDDVAFLKTGLL